MKTSDLIFYLSKSIEKSGDLPVYLVFNGDAIKLYAFTKNLKQNKILLIAEIEEEKK